MNETNKESKEKFEGSLRLLAKTSFIVFFGIFISKILGYTYRVIIARYYGPEVYGLFSLAFMITTWFTAIAALGLTDGILRFIPLYRGKKKTNEISYLVKLVIKINLLLGIISSIALFFLSDIIAIQIFHNASLGYFLKIFSFFILVSLLNNIFLAVIRAYEKISWFSFIFNILQNVSRVFILILLILIGVKSESTAWSFNLSLVACLIVSYLICKYKISTVFIDSGKVNKRKLTKELFFYSFPILFSSIISTLFYSIDSFSLGYYKSAVEVGLYNAAVPIAMLLLIASELFMQLFFPLITRHYSIKNFKLIGDLSKQVNKWIYLVNVPIFLIIFIFPGAVINILFGANYISVENALRILAIGALISSLSSVSVQLISMIGKSKLILMNVTIAAIINFILNSILIPLKSILFLNNENGLVGAAMATMISILIFNLLFYIQVHKYLKIIPLRRKIINISIIALSSFIILYVLRNLIPTQNIFILLVLLIFFVLFYLLLIFIFRGLDENDWFIIKSVFKKGLNLIRVNKK